jgi:hypothetical protein
MTHGFGVISERSETETSPYGSTGNSLVRHVGETYDDINLRRPGPSPGLAAGGDRRWQCAGTCARRSSYRGSSAPPAVRGTRPQRTRSNRARPRWRPVPGRRSSTGDRHVWPSVVETVGRASHGVPLSVNGHWAAWGPPIGYRSPRLSPRCARSRSWPARTSVVDSWCPPWPAPAPAHVCVTSGAAWVTVVPATEHSRRFPVAFRLRHWALLFAACREATNQLQGRTKNCQSASQGAGAAGSA